MNKIEIKLTPLDKTINFILLRKGGEYYNFEFHDIELNIAYVISVAAKSEEDAKNRAYLIIDRYNSNINNSHKGQIFGLLRDFGFLRGEYEKHSDIFKNSAASVFLPIWKGNVVRVASRSFFPLGYVPSELTKMCLPEKSIDSEEQTNTIISNSKKYEKRTIFLLFIYMITCILMMLLFFIGLDERMVSQSLLGYFNGFTAAGLMGVTVSLVGIYTCWRFLGALGDDDV